MKRFSVHQFAVVVHDRRLRRFFLRLLHTDADICGKSSWRMVAVIDCSHGCDHLCHINST